MATKEEVAELCAALEALHGDEFFRRIGETGAGVSAVMRYLYEADGPVSAGEISRFLQVSTARVAVLLKKMESRELIDRVSDAHDARKSMILLSDQGRALCTRMLGELSRRLSEVIDRVGRARIREFIAVGNEIRTAVQPPEWELPWRGPWPGGERDGGKEQGGKRGMKKC